MYRPTGVALLAVVAAALGGYVATLEPGLPTPFWRGDGA